MTHPFIRLSLLGESIACDNAQAIGILDPLKPITQCGPAGPIQLLSGLSVQPDGKIDLNGWTDSRAASLWVPDYNGVLTEIPGGIPLVVDSGTDKTPRVVRNILSDFQAPLNSSDDMTGNSGTGHIVTFDGLESTLEVTDSTAYARFYKTTSTSGYWHEVGDEFIISCEIKGVGSSVGKFVYLAIGQGGDASAQVPIEVPSTYQRVQFKRNPAKLAGEDVIYIALKIGSATLGIGDKIKIRHLQVEKVSAQTVASEYMPYDGASMPFAYYTTTNANTVDANSVVTEAVGSPLPVTGEWAFQHWPGSTNYFLNSSAPATQTITLSATGDYTLSVHGAGSVAIAAGTAVGTGWGTATDGSPVTVNISTAGSVTCTVTGSPTAVQLENQPFASPVIQTAGAALTRDACVIDHDTTGAIDDDKGYAMVAFTINSDAATSNIGWHLGLILYSNNTFDALYSYDGVSASGITNVGLLAGTSWVAIARWDRTLNEKQIAIRPQGSSTWVSSNVITYPGAYAQYGLSMCKNANHKKEARAVEILNQSLTMAELQDRYSLANLGY